MKLKHPNVDLIALVVIVASLLLLYYAYKNGPGRKAIEAESQKTNAQFQAPAPAIGIQTPIP